MYWEPTLDKPKLGILPSVLTRHLSDTQIENNQLELGRLEATHKELELEQNSHPKKTRVVMPNKVGIKDEAGSVWVNNPAATVALGKSMSPVLTYYDHGRVINLVYRNEHGINDFTALDFDYKEKVPSIKTNMNKEMVFNILTATRIKEYIRNISNKSLDGSVPANIHMYSANHTNKTIFIRQSITIDTISMVVIGFTTYTCSDSPVILVVRPIPRGLKTEPGFIDKQKTLALEEMYPSLTLNSPNTAQVFIKARSIAQFDFHFPEQTLNQHIELFKNSFVF